MSYKILTVAVAVLAAQIITVFAMDAKCKGIDVKIQEELMMNIKECAESVGFNSKKMTPEQATCLTKCILEKKQLLDAAGKPHKENVMKFLDVTMPEAVKADIKMHIGKCLDEHGSKGTPGDATCMSYDPVSKCIDEAMVDVCKI